MPLLMVCLCLAVTTTAANSPSALTNTSFFSMPVQFSMAAPLSSSSSEWSPSIASRRGYPPPPPPRSRRRKHRLSYEEMMHMRRHPLHHRSYPKYPPFLEPYSHNYKHSQLHHPPPPPHRFPPEQRPQHSPYIEYPPYAPRYQPTGHAHSEPTRHEQQYHQSDAQQYHQSDAQQYHQSDAHQHQHHQSSHQPLEGEYSQNSPQFQHNDHNTHLNNYQSPSAEYQQYPSQFLSNEQSYPTKHQTQNFEYPQHPPDYQTGETFSQLQNQNYHNIPEPHIPHYQQSEYMDNSVYGGLHQPSHMQPYTNHHPHPPDTHPPPEYNPEMTKELLELNQEIGLMQHGGNSSKSILHLLVPLLMLGISIPAIGYMYSHMIRRRSFEDWTSQDMIQEYMHLLQRGIECYQQKGKCSVS